MIEIRSAATHSTQLVECMTEILRITVDQWTGYHKFILTDAIKGEKAILGNDFLKRRYCVHKGIRIFHDGDENVEDVVRLAEDVVIPPCSEAVIKA
jgi:hypothetical protein